MVSNLKYVLLFFVVFISCSQKKIGENLIGKWKFNGIVPVDTTKITSTDLTVIFWLTQLSEKTTIEFTRDSCIMQNNDSIVKRYKYKLNGNKLTLLGKGDNDSDEIDIINDSVIHVKNDNYEVRFSK
jgi:hypothetical protein